jgi:hypothetical protein
MGRPRKEASKRELPATSPLEGWAPPRAEDLVPSVPVGNTSLKIEMIPAIATGRAQGLSVRACAGLPSVRVPEDRLEQWLRVGEAAALAEIPNIYALLYLEWLRGESQYETWALKHGHAAGINKRYTDKFIRWRLALMNRREYTPQSGATGTATGTLNGTPFELITPEEAARELDEKLNAFLEEAGEVSDE